VAWGANTLAKLLQCALLRIVGLLALEKELTVHAAGSSSDCLGAALLHPREEEERESDRPLYWHRLPMRDAVGRAA
jgi:hypothetical protein